MDIPLIKKHSLYSALTVIVGLFTGCSYLNPSPDTQIWKNDLRSEVRALGYRNWIVIADASFPFHHRQGIRTVVAPAETPEVVSTLLDAIEETQHIKPHFYSAREMRSLSNDRAPGAAQYRRDLKMALRGYPSRELDEATLKKLLQGTSSSYAVLVVKTQTSLPYSSIFIELDSGYWDGESEQELRKNINSRKAPTKAPLSKTVDRSVALAW